MTKPRLKLNNDGTAYRVDAWSNGVSGQGVPGIDKSQATRYMPSLFSRMDQITLGLLYRTDWLSRKICQRPADDATRRFIEIKGLTDEQRDLVNERIESLRLRRKIKQSIAWSRLYGGAAVIRVYANGGRPDTEYRGGGKLIDLISIDRYNLAPQDLNDDATSPYFQKPETYRATNGVVYHRSRISLFTGADLTYDQQRTEQGWGGSYVELAYEAIKSFQGSMQDVNFLLQESGIGILKMPGTTQIKAMGGGPAQALMNRANIFAEGKSIYRVGVLDAQEDFQFANRSLQGIPDILDRFMTVIAGASEMTELILFGKSPSGLNASQEEQLSSYYDIVATIQEGEPTDLINDVMRDLEVELGIEKIDWEWQPLLQVSSVNRATIMTNTATAIASIADVAGLEPKEVRNALNATGFWDLPEDDDNAGDDDPLGLNEIGEAQNAND